MPDKEAMYQHGVWIHLDAETYKHLKHVQEEWGMKTEAQVVETLLLKYRCDC
jgi:hypothetical protein